MDLIKNNPMEDTTLAVIRNLDERFIIGTVAWDGSQSSDADTYIEKNES